MKSPTWTKGPVDLRYRAGVVEVPCSTVTLWLQARWNGSCTTPSALLIAGSVMSSGVATGRQAIHGGISFRR